MQWDAIVNTCTYCKPRHALAFDELRHGLDSCIRPSRYLPALTQANPHLPLDREIPYKQAQDIAPVLLYRVHTENAVLKLGSYDQQNQLNKSNLGSTPPWADDLRPRFERHRRDGVRTYVGHLRAIRRPLITAGPTASQLIYFDRKLFGKKSLEEEFFFFFHAQSELSSRENSFTANAYRSRDIPCNGVDSINAQDAWGV